MEVAECEPSCCQFASRSGKKNGGGEKDERKRGPLEQANIRQLIMVNRNNVVKVGIFDSMELLRLSNLHLPRHCLALYHLPAVNLDWLLPIR